MIVKKRYLFPILWIGFELAVFVVPLLFPVVYIFSLPSMLIVNSLSSVLSGPTDTTYFIILGAVLQSFLLGCIWDFFAARFGRDSALDNHTVK
jgi:hypothetical protein